MDLVRPLPLEGLDWGDEVDEAWLPNAASCEYWLRHRIEQVQRVIGDDAEKARKYGWEREWPPFEGFPTHEDYARVSTSRLGPYATNLAYRTRLDAADEQLDRSDLTRTSRDALKALRVAYAEGLEASWGPVVEGDPFLGWMELLRLGAAMEID